MITAQDIIKYSKPHPSEIEGARQTRLYNNALEMSIVGGGRGLYGDFEETFEIAIFDRESGEFVTKFFYPDGGDDVVGYMSAEKLEEFVNKIFHSGFQVR